MAKVRKYASWSSFYFVSYYYLGSRSVNREEFANRESELTPSAAYVLFLLG